MLQEVVVRSAKASAARGAGTAGAAFAAAGQAPSGPFPAADSCTAVGQPLAPITNNQQLPAPGSRQQQSPGKASYGLNPDPMISSAGAAGVDASPNTKHKQGQEELERLGRATARLSLQGGSRGGGGLDSGEGATGAVQPQQQYYPPSFTMSGALQMPPAGSAGCTTGCAQGFGGSGRVWWQCTESIMGLRVKLADE